MKIREYESKRGFYYRPLERFEREQEASDPSGHEFAANRGYVEDDSFKN